MVSYLAILMFMALLMAVLFLVFRAGANAHKGKAEYQVLRLLQWVTGVMLINRVATIMTVLLLYLNDPRLELWLVVAGIVASIKVVVIAILLFELLGGSVKRALYIGWRWLGEYLGNGE